MADGDIFHDKLSKTYQPVYQQVLQQHHSPALLAHTALEPLRRDIQMYGNRIPDFLAAVGRQIEEAIDRPLLRQISDMDDLKQGIERQSRHVYANSRALAIAMNACESLINGLQTATPPQPGVELIQRYFRGIYDARFDAIARIEPADPDPATDQETVVGTLNQMHEYVDSYIADFAVQAARHNSVEHLRLPSSPLTDMPVDLDENLLAPAEQGG